MSRDFIGGRIAIFQRIHTPEAIEELEANGTRQWNSIRGLNWNKPILFVAHGGQGSPMTVMRRAYQKP